MWNLKFDASTDDDKERIGIIALFENDIAFVELERVSVISKVCFLLARQVLEKSDLVDIRLCELVVFLDYFLHGFLEDLVRNTQEFAMLK